MTALQKFSHAWENRNKRCFQCNGRFGLTRHRSALKQFCSSRCLEEFRIETERESSRIKKWTDFLDRKF